MYHPHVLPVKQFLEEAKKPSTLPRTGKPPKPKFFIIEQVEYFCQTTANHAFAHVVDKDEIYCLRVFWALVIAALTVFISIFAHMSIVNLLSRSLTIEFLEEIAKGGKNATLPDIHICDTSIFSKTRLEEMGFNKATALYLTLAMSPNAAHSMFEKNKNHKKALKEDFERILGSRSVKDVIHKAALQCADIVFGCTKAGEFYPKQNCCDTFFHPKTVVTIFGSCIGTYGKAIKQEYDSRDAGFVVYTTPNYNDTIEFEGKVVKAEYILQKGMYYGVSSAAEHTETVLQTDGYYAAPNSWVSVPITKSIVDHSELKGNALAPFTCVYVDDPVYKALRTPEHLYYSKKNCYMSHKHNFYRLKKNCSVIFYPYGNSTKICAPDDLMDSAIDDKSDDPLDDECPVECVLESYAISPSSSHMHEAILAEEYNSNNTNFEPIVFHFFYATFKYQVRISHTATYLKWLGEVGGNMGLFLGASLITMLEILALFFRCCVKFACRKHKV